MLSEKCYNDMEPFILAAFALYINGMLTDKHFKTFLEVLIEIYDLHNQK